MPRLRSRRAAALLGILALLALPAALLLPSCGGEPGHLTASVATIDFGLVPRGEQPERRFQVKNEGGRGVVISAIKPSCQACLRVEPGWRRSLGPGEQTEVVVLLTTAQVPPQKLEGKSLQVVSDDEKAPLIQIPVHGEIETQVTLSPGIVRVDSSDAAGRGEPRRLRLRPGQGYEAKIDKVENLRTDWFEVKSEKVPEGWDLVLRVKPDPARRGRADTHLLVHVSVTGHGLPPQTYELLVRIEGTW